MAIRLKEEKARVFYQIHPAAMLLPEMTGDEWNKFVCDIRDNGQREPIIVHEGKVIDGRHRLRACAWLKIEPKVKLFQGREEDIVPFVMSLNVHRRHLTESQRAMVASKVANLKVGNLSKSANLPVSPVSQSDAAKMLNVSERSVRTAKQVIAKGEPEVIAAVESGKISLNEASKVVQLRPEMQRAAMELPKQERRETLAGNTLEERGVFDADPHGEERYGLIYALEELCKVVGTPEQLIGGCPKFVAPQINKHFRQAFMRMQALHAVYQNWEFRNVAND